jgi:hypothetical protein
MDRWTSIFETDLIATRRHEKPRNDSDSCASSRFFVAIRLCVSAPQIPIILPCSYCLPLLDAPLDRSCSLFAPLTFSRRKSSLSASAFEYNSAHSTRGWMNSPKRNRDTRQAMHAEAMATRRHEKPRKAEPAFLCLLVNLGGNSIPAQLPPIQTDLGGRERTQGTQRVLALDSPLSTLDILSASSAFFGGGKQTMRN